MLPPDKPGVIPSAHLLAAGRAAAELRRMGETVVAVRIAGTAVDSFETAETRGRAALDEELRQSVPASSDQKDERAAAAKLEHGREHPRQQKLVERFFASKLGRKVRAVMAMRPEIITDRVLVELTLSGGREFVVPMRVARMPESLRWLTFSSHAELLAAVPVPVGPVIIGGAALWAGANAGLAHYRGDHTLARGLAAVASKFVALFGPSFLFPVDSVVMGTVAALDLDARRALRRGEGIADFELSRPNP